MSSYAARNSWSFSLAAQVDLRRPVVAEQPVHLNAQPTALTLDAARTAVIVIDMQNDFCTAGGWLAGIGVDVSPLGSAVAAIAELLPVLRGSAVPIVWLNWGNRPDQANLPPGVKHVYDPAGTGVGIGHEMSNGSRVLTAGSWGAAVVDGLTADDCDIWIEKYRMSGFYDTPLDSVLRNLRVDTLLFCGVNSDQCVYATLIDAACLGYDVVLIEDASATTSPAYCHDATIYNTRQCFGFSVTSADLISGLSVQHGAQAAGAS